MEETKYVNLATVSSGSRQFDMSPRSILIMFTSLCFFVYFDRGVYASVLDDVQKAFGLSDLQGGICSSGYLVCFCLSSPVFAQLAKYKPPLLMSALGMSVWTGAVVFSGFSQDFWTLLLARALTGVGEASFLVVSASIIDYISPKNSRSTYLAIFYAAIPIGYAVGAGLTGVILGAEPFGKDWSWRSAYFLEAALVLPLVLWIFKAKGPSSMYEISNESEGSGHSVVEKKIGWHAVKHDLITLASNRLYITIVLGYATQTFFIGAVAVFGVKYIDQQFDVGKTNAGLIFGGVTFVTGLLGSALGGILLDMTKPTGDNVHFAQNEYAAHRVILICSIFAAPCSIISFLMDSLAGFVPLLFLGEFAAFMMTGPINNAVIWCVPVYLQPTAMALSTLSIHLLGDALSPIVIGAISDSKSLQTGLFVGSAVLVLPILFFGLGLITSYRMTKVNSSPTLLQTRRSDDE